ncbi:hypothetical protein MCJ35_28345 [Enterocloster sp. OA13]|uniref:hypothetical protein n=1 Tax=Enterocloster sp. OA13 TaxID=2914161 RepID=UPI0004ADC3BD|nr:hypothetical protein [Enterocloster sp. OA13]
MDWFSSEIFDKDVDYGQIKHSSEKTVEYSTGKEGIVNVADYSITKWSEWEAVFIYEGSDITGEILKLQK